eukprot:GILI01013126.1.p1 GENE.GILI01013126.1~~GILI01013126.1.p1  ORF type:complete len:469 (+),score=49.80 GILI01013126.1:26-1432(+)
MSQVNTEDTLDGIQAGDLDATAASPTDYSQHENQPLISETRKSEVHVELPPLRRAIFTTLPVFMGYSGLVVLQEGLKTRLDIKSSTNDAYIFGLAVGNLYIGNLIFRLLHNVIFTFLRPRQRVMVAYVCMIAAFCTLIFPYYFSDYKSQAFVFVAYLIGGMGIGTFESNVISSLTPLGHATKKWAVLGVPVGFNLISVGSFAIFAIAGKTDMLQGIFYGIICAGNLIGLLFYIFAIPNVPFEASNDTVRKFWKDLNEWREWLPIIWKHCLAMSLNMMCVSLFASVVLFIYNVDPMPLWPKSETTIPKNAFLGVYFSFSFLGDFTSRRIAYAGKERNPFIYLILSAVGVGVVLSKTALVAPLGMFLIMFANGSIYAQTTKYIDMHVPKRYNLIALSVWLFIGDIGSYIGSQITQPLQTALGLVPTHDGNKGEIPPSNTTNTTATGTTMHLPSTGTTETPETGFIAQLVY